MPSPPRTGYLPRHTGDSGGDGPWPGVVPYPDAGGARAVFRDMADRLASAMRCWCPTCTTATRAGRRSTWSTCSTTPGERKRLFGMISKVTPGTRWPPTRRVLRLPGRPPGGPRRVLRHHRLLHGWADVADRWPGCPDRVAAAMSFHGGGLASDDRQPASAGRPDAGAPSTSAAPPTTRRSPPKQAEILDQALTDAGIRNTPSSGTRRYCTVSRCRQRAVRRGGRREALGRDEGVLRAHQGG